MSASDEELIQSMELYEEDQALVDALDAFETERFANNAEAYYEAREAQRDYQRNLIQQQGGQIDPNQPGRFIFELQPLSQDRNRRFGIEERRYQANLRQEGNIIDHIAPTLRDGLQNAIQQLIEQRNVPDNHRVYFDLFSDRLRDQSYCGNGLVAADWRNSTRMVDQIFQHLQSALNSNESFEMNDTFRLEVTTVAPRVVRGTGKPRRKKIGYLGAEDFLLKNRSVIKINNPNDKMCAAHAIVAAKATVDLPPRHGTRRQLTKTEKGVSDRPQQQAAYRLTRQAGVPEDTAAWQEELKNFKRSFQITALSVCTWDETVKPWPLPPTIRRKKTW